MDDKGRKNKPIPTDTSLADEFKNSDLEVRPLSRVQTPKHPIDELEPSVSIPEATPATKIVDAIKVVTGSDLLPNLPLDEHVLGDKNHTVIGSYRVTKTLGQGTFGKVKEGVHMFTKQKVSASFVHFRLGRHQNPGEGQDHRCERCRARYAGNPYSEDREAPPYHPAV